MKVRLIGMLMAAGAWTCPAQVESSPAPNAASPPSPHVRLGFPPERFRARATSHFVLSHDTTPEVLRTVIHRLDRVYTVALEFARACGLLRPDRPPGLLEVLLFDRFEDYAAFARTRDQDATTTEGFFHWQDNVAVFFNATTRPDVVEISRRIDAAREQLLAIRRGRGGADVASDLQRQIVVWQTQREQFIERANVVTLMHETAHQCLFNFGVHSPFDVNPGWLVEGMACLFEVPQTLSGGRFLKINAARLADALEAVAPLPPADGSAPPSAPATSFMPLRDFISRRELVSERSRPDIVTLYAQSWALVHYLQAKHGEGFARYLRSITERNPNHPLTGDEEIAAFEACFGALDVNFEQAWIDFIRLLKGA